MASPILEKNKYVFLERPAIEVHSKTDIASRGRQIALFQRELQKYGIRLKDLGGKNPSRTVRNLLLGIAHVLLEEDELLDRFVVERRLPLKRLSMLLEEPLFLLQRWQDHLTAYVLLLQGDRYYHLKSYLRFAEAKAVAEVEPPAVETTGITLGVYGRKSLVLTSQGEFRVLHGTGPLGEVQSGTPAPGFTRISLKPFAAVLLALLLAGAVYYGTSQTVSTTIFLRASGEVQLSFNPLGNLVEYRTLNSRGALYMEEGIFHSKDMDTVLGEVLEQAYIREHLREGDEIVLLVSGRALPEDAFHAGRFHDRVKAYRLRYKINNDGSFLFLD